MIKIKGSPSGREINVDISHPKKVNAFDEGKRGGEGDEGGEGGLRPRREARRHYAGIIDFHK